MAMLRAGADVIGYELREEFAQRAIANVRGFLGDEAASRYRVELRNCYDGIDESDLDRVVLDLPEPWQVVKHAERALRPGGLLVGVHADDRAGGPVAGDARVEPVRARRDARGAAPLLAHRGTVGAS